MDGYCIAVHVIFLSPVQIFVKFARLRKAAFESSEREQLCYFLHAGYVLEVKS